MGVGRRGRGLAVLALGVVVTLCLCAAGALATTTPARRPVVADVKPGAVQQTSAVLTGAIDPEGVVTRYTFEYGTTTAFGTSLPWRSAGSGRRSVRISEDLSSLALATVYHYRLVATNHAGTRYGPAQTFTTAGYFANPVYAGSMPDPYVLDVNDSHNDYWAFGTGNDFAVLHSTNLVNWTGEPTAFRSRPQWVSTAPDWHPWAPSVIQTPQSCPGTHSHGCFVMFYTGLSAEYRIDCVGTATSTTPGGPYTDRGPLGATPTLTTLLKAQAMPIGCGDGTGVGNIDPSPFIDAAGQAFLYVSTDFKCATGGCVVAPTISVIPLSSDLLSASGNRTALFSGVADTWESVGTMWPTVEGPSLEYHDGTYYLFFSGGGYDSHYAMGYATSASPTGPFVTPPQNPILDASSTGLTPGGGDDFVTGPHGGQWLIYAAREGSLTAPRSLWLSPVSWGAPSVPGGPDTPVLQAPTTAPSAIQP